MDRLLGLYRTTSAIEPVVSLVVANLIPLAGVVLWGWDLWTILALYWVENGIIGLFNLAKILMAEGSLDLPAGVQLPGASTADRAGISPLLPIGRVGLAIFFLIHYGIFWVGHGVFVLFVLPGFGDARIAFDGIAANLDQVLYGAIGLAISHGISFWLNYIGRGEYRRTSPYRLMGAPYARVVVLHVAIIIGAFVSMILGTPIGALIVLVLLKTGLDLSFHRREHEGLADAGSGLTTGR